MAREETVATPRAPRIEASPERTCIVTRHALPKEALIRFVVGPGDKLVPDLASKLPGRGIYVSVSRLLVAEAIAKRSFSKAAKTQVHIPDGFLEQLEQLMAKRVGEALSIDRKSVV